MNNKKIITRRQMKVVKAKDSSSGRQNVLMQDFRAKGGVEILKNRKVYQRQFWRDLRENSLRRKSEGGDMGFTKKNLIGFFAEKINNHEDKFTNRQIRKIFTKVYGLKRNKVFRKAAELRYDEKRLENHQKMAEKMAEHQKDDANFRGHINELVSKGRENAHPGAHVSLPEAVAHGEMKRSDSYKQSEKKENIFQNNKIANFETSNKNLRSAESFFSHTTAEQSDKNNSNNFGHLLFLKNKQHNYTDEEAVGIEDTKARLARIQGKADNYDISSEKKDLAA